MSLTVKSLFLFLCFVGFGTIQIKAQVRLSLAESEKLAVEKPKPVYPQLAKMMKLQETVKVEASVSEDGQVISAKMISGSPIFRLAAIEAAKKHTFKSYMVDAKPMGFITTIELPFSLGIPADEYKRQKQISEKFFAEEKKCRELIRQQKWQQAGSICEANARLSEQFSSDRELEKMGAYQKLGYALMGQKRYQEALTSYLRAADVVRLKLTDKDSEMARLYGDIAIAHHAMGDLAKAREMYRKAETAYQNAYANIGEDGLDEFVTNLRQSYMNSLKKLIEYHLIAAEQAGATNEIEEIKKLLKSLPEK